MRDGESRDIGQNCLEDGICPLGHFRGLAERRQKNTLVCVCSSSLGQHQRSPVLTLGSRDVGTMMRNRSSSGAVSVEVKVCAGKEGLKEG